MKINNYLTNQENHDIYCCDKELISMLINHLQYSLKDVNEYDELTNEERSIITPHQFKLLKAQFMKPVVIQLECVHCNRTFNLVVDCKSITDYFDHGVLIQNAFSYLSADDRELMISNLCKDCFKELMKEETDGEPSA